MLAVMIPRFVIAFCFSIIDHRQNIIVIAISVGLRSCVCWWCFFWNFSGFGGCQKLIFPVVYPRPGKECGFVVGSL